MQLTNVPQAHIRGGVLLRVSVICKHCGRQKLPGDIATGGEARGYLCWQCLQNHHRNLNDLAAGRPRACNECQVSFDQLARVNPNATMTVQLKDGVLQLLCRPCAAIYEPKSGMYKNTAYGRVSKIDRGIK